MQQSARVLGAVGITWLASMLAACSSLNREPPDVYSTIPTQYYATHQSKILDRPTIGPHDPVKPSFIAFVYENCLQKPLQSKIECGVQPPTDPSSYQCWARRNPASSKCANLVITYAMDQCVAKVGTQNTFAAKTNLYLGFFLAAAGLATDAAVIANAGTASAGLVAAAVATGATNLQKVVPTTASTSLQNVVMAGQLYASTANLNDTDLSCLDGGGTPECKERVLLRYSRLHDAVYSGCPAGAY